MSDYTFYVGQAGIDIGGYFTDEDDTAINISSASSYEITVTGPFGSRTVTDSDTAEFVGTGTDGGIQTPLLAADTAVPGRIRWRGKAVVGDVTHKSPWTVATVLA